MIRFAAAPGQRVHLEHRFFYVSKDRFNDPLPDDHAYWCSAADGGPHITTLYDPPEVFGCLRIVGADPSVTIEQFAAIVDNPTVIVDDAPLPPTARGYTLDLQVVRTGRVDYAYDAPCVTATGNPGVAAKMLNIPDEILGGS